MRSNSAVRLAARPHPVLHTSARGGLSESLGETADSQQDEGSRDPGIPKILFGSLRSLTDSSRSLPDSSGFDPFGKSQRTDQAL